MFISLQELLVEEDLPLRVKELPIAVRRKSASEVVLAEFLLDKIFECVGKLTT